MAEESRTSEENASEEEKQEKAPPKKRGKKIKSTKKTDAAKISEKSEVQPEENVESEKPKKSQSKGSKKRRALDHPKTVDMILEAIENLEEGKNGSSVQKIKAYIINNYKVREDMVKSMMKRALTSALKDNILSRPKNQLEKAQLLCGRYVINPKQPEAQPAHKPRPSQLRQFKSQKSKKSSKKRKRKRSTY